MLLANLGWSIPPTLFRKTSLNCPGRPLRKALTAASGVLRGVKVSASSVVVHIVLAVIFTPRYKTDGFSSASTPVGAFVSMFALRGNLGRCKLLRTLAALICLIIAQTGCASACVAPTGAVPVANSAGWYCKTQSDSVVVFVHGFTSDNRQAWLGERSASPSYWPQLVVDDDQVLDAAAAAGQNRPSVYLAGYFTATDSTNYAVENAAEELFRSISDRRDGQSVLDKRNILFVGHSAGGVVTRQMLVTYAQRFAGRRIGLLLVASPSKGSVYAKRLAPPKALAENAFAEQLEIDSPFLLGLDEKFRGAINVGGQLEGLAGIELYEHRIFNGESESALVRMMRAFGETIVGKLLGRIVEQNSAAVYFPNPVLIPGSDHSSIARPDDVNSMSHQQLREAFRRTIAARAQPCDPPDGFQITFKVAPDRGAKSKAERTIYQLMQVTEGGARDLREVPPQSSAHRDFPTFALAGPPFACPGDEFWGRLSRVPTRSVKVTEMTPAQYACFRRQPDSKASEARFVCDGSEECEVDAKAPGLAGRCDREVLVASQPDAQDRAPHWRIPSLQALERLPESERSNYTEFSVDSSRLTGLAGVTNMTYAITVNETPIYIDGLKPFSQRTAFSAKGGVHLTFGLENLGFNGGVDGREVVQVDLRFYADAKLIKTARLRLPYVSYRHAHPAEVKDELSHDGYSWHAYYRPAKVQASYEVMLDIGDMDRMRKKRTELDDSGKVYKELPVIGVIRPPRSDNPVSGMIIGLQLADGQVRSLFDRDEADLICKWVRSNEDFSEAQRQGSYIFQFPAETFTDLKDRGRKIMKCKDV